MRPAPVYIKSTRRLWCSFDLNEFQSALRLSLLCNSEQWRRLDGNGLMKLYDDTVVELLDGQVPVHTVTCRRRPSDGWFDSKCKHAKRRVRRLERVACHVRPMSDCQSPPCKHGTLNDASILSLFVENRRIFGRRVLMLISGNHDVCGSLLTSCLAAVMCRPLTSVHLFSTSFLMRK